MSNVSSAIIFGSIYWRMGKKQTAVQNRLGLLQVRRSTSMSVLKNSLPCLSDMHIYALERNYSDLVCSTRLEKSDTLCLSMQACDKVIS